MCGAKFGAEPSGFIQIWIEIFRPNFIDIFSRKISCLLMTLSAIYLSTNVEKLGILVLKIPQPMGLPNFIRAITNVYNLHEFATVGDLTNAAN